MMNLGSKILKSSRIGGHNIIHLRCNRQARRCRSPLNSSRAVANELTWAELTGYYPMDLSRCQPSQLALLEAEQAAQAETSVPPQDPSKPHCLSYNQSKNLSSIRSSSISQLLDGPCNSNWCHIGRLATRRHSSLPLQIVVRGIFSLVKRHGRYMCSRQ